MPSEQPPTRGEGLTAEDRARLDELVEMAGRLASIGGFPENVADALTRALAALDHQTKALEAADELEDASEQLQSALRDQDYPTVAVTDCMGSVRDALDRFATTKGGRNDG